MANPEKEIQNNDLNDARSKELFKEAVPYGFNKVGQITTEETVKYIKDGTISKNMASKGFEAGRTFKGIGILGKRIARVFDVIDFFKAQREKGWEYAIGKEGVGALLPFP